MNGEFGSLSASLGASDASSINAVHEYKFPVVLVHAIFVDETIHNLLPSSEVSNEPVLRAGG